MLNLDNIKKYKTPIILLIVAFVLFMFMSIFMQEEKNEISTYVEEEKITDEIKYDEEIEKKLEKILSSAEGVGKVKVAVTLINSGEIYPFTQNEKVNESTEEKDSSGGSRSNKVESLKNEISYVKESDSSESLVVSKSDMPDIAGVIVCAEGGDSYVVKERIIKAVKALCNINVTQIEILPMK